MAQSSDDEIGNATEMSLKVPPNSIEAEQSLLGGLMLDNTAWDKIADLIVGGDFYRKDHQVIFSGIASLIEASEACDVVTLSEYLESNSQLEAAGGLEYIATLANETPGASNAVSYAKILRERSVLRALISAGNQISGNAYLNDGRTTSELVDDAERLVFEIAEKDLELRGAGDIYGVRQSGLMDLKIANPIRDSDLLEEAQEDAIKIAKNDDNYAKTIVLRWIGNRVDYSES
mgnify:CR=1 FL=1